LAPTAARSRCLQGAAVALAPLPLLDDFNGRE
jgi:hypothetical protein